MHEMIELEERWKRYRKQRNMRKVLTVAIPVVLLLAVVAAFRYGGALVSNEKNTPPKHNEANVTTASSKSVVKASQSPHSMEQTSRPIPQKRRLRIEVSPVNDRKKLKEIEKRFKLAHDPEDALFLAKQYLHMKKYKTAEYWALQTNRLDDMIEESWLIFAVAKVKQGKEDEALRVLQVYIDKSSSQRAMELYQRIKSGKRPLLDE